MVDKNKWAVVPESGWEMHVLYVQIEVSHDQKYMEKQLPSKRAIPEA